MSLWRNALLVLALLAPIVSAETRTAASASYDDVGAAVAVAAAGDTVLVPPGTAEWTRTLVITRGILLKGAGMDKTVLVNRTPDHRCLVQYHPADYGANDPFRLTGFAFDLADNGAGFVLGVHAKKAPFTVQTCIRIDHNRFMNDSTRRNQAVWNYGAMYGVVDSNVFDNVAYPTRNAPQVGGSSWWDHFPYTFGRPDQNLCYEDNLFNGVTIVAASQFRGRYMFRYNPINLAANAHPLFDMHGNQPSGANRGAAQGMYSTFGGEMYGNLINENDHDVGLLDQRGGKVLVFYNNIVGTRRPYMKLRDEYPDSDEPTTSTQPQHVSESYYWNNRFNAEALIRTGVPGAGDAPRTATGGGADFLEDAARTFDAGYGRGVYGLSICGGRGAGEYRRIIRAEGHRLTVDAPWQVVPDATSQYRIVSDWGNVLAENRDFFNQAEPFDGTAGIGVGPLSDRPATCVPGVAYWATDQTPADLPRMVGARPAMPIAGVLYRCVAANTWEEYYRPFPYPHPLRVAGPVADTDGDGNR
jgi:hypothetical protein